MRVSKNKDEIIQALSLCEEPLNAQEIYDVINKNSKVNLSTIYRCINSLCKENVISKEIREDKNAYYSLNTKIHKHHLICQVCKRDTLIDICPIKQLALDIKESTGFSITNHSLQISGVCKKCSDKLEKSQNKSVKNLKLL